MKITIEQVTFSFEGVVIEDPDERIAELVRPFIAPEDDAALKAKFPSWGGSEIDRKYRIETLEHVERLYDQLVDEPSPDERKNLRARICNALYDGGFESNLLLVQVQSLLARLRAGDPSIPVWAMADNHNPPMEA